MRVTGETSGNIQQATVGMSTGLADIGNIARNTGERAQIVLTAVREMKERVVEMRTESDRFLETVRHT